jgi:DNA repair protein RadC
MEKYRLTLVKENEYSLKNTKIGCSEEAYQFAKSFYENSPSEKLGVLFLDIKNNIISFNDELFKGTINFAAFSTREVLQTALLLNAVNIIIIHNHPSGDTKPSEEDKHLTRRLWRACKLFDMKLIDHLIIGDNYFSFADSGLISYTEIEI